MEGSLEEEELVQMVHDFIESESPSPIPYDSSQLIPFNHQPTYLKLQGILGSVSDTEMLLLEKVLKYLTKLITEKKTASLKNWLVMCLRIEGFDVTLCKTCWKTTLDCPGGDYEYIDVTTVDKSDGSVVRTILDIDFKSQFLLARPTSTYTQLSNTLPNIFVGSEEKLIKVISLLCSAAKQSFTERDLHIPPWRRSNYMLSKWLSITPAKSSRENSEAKKSGYISSKFSKWAPSKTNPKRTNLGGGSGLSSQFSNMSVKYCC